MSIPKLKTRQEFAKVMTAACVRLSSLENYHHGNHPVSKTGDYSDVKVIDANGRVILWKDVSHINQDEMKALMKEVVNRVFTFLEQSVFSRSVDDKFGEQMARSIEPWAKKWDTPTFLPDILMPVKGMEE